MTEHEEMIRAADAKHLLANEMLREALEVIEANVVNKLAEADLAPDRILKLQAILAGKRAFQKYLHMVIQTGKLAEEAEKQKRSIADRILRRA